MPKEHLRNESTEQGQKIWQNVDQAAKGAPQWVKDRLVAKEPDDAGQPIAEPEVGEDK